jgi:uncharacterized protein
MKIFAFILSFVLISVCSFGQSKTIKYDEQRAKKAGADEYGMKPYVMAILKKGTVEIKDSTRMANLMTGHLKNIFRLADEGKLAVAGPFINDNDFEGVFIFNVATIEEAKTLTDSDPAVKAGVFAIEFHRWYASAALTEIMDSHKAMQKKGIID